MDDDYDPDRVAALFAEDGLWSINVGGVGGTVKGRENIKKHSVTLRNSSIWRQHNLFAPIIEVAEDGKTAVGYFYLVCLITLAVPDAKEGKEAYVRAGKYKDKFVKIDGKWYFEEMVGTINLSSPWSEGWVKHPLP